MLPGLYKGKREGLGFYALGSVLSDCAPYFDFFFELRDETSTRAKRAGDLLAQRLADGGVH